MRVLLTGAAGFIGSRVRALLEREGHDVLGLDLMLAAAHGSAAAPAGVVVGDVRDRALLERLLPGVDAVVHTSAMVGMGVDLQDLPDYVSHNDLATAVLLAAAARAGMPRLVLSSSMVVYGEGDYRCAEHGGVEPLPRDPVDLRAGRYEPRCPRCREPLAPSEVDESARVDPRSAYAATKVAQEHLCRVWAATTGAALVVLRYHNVYGPGMPRDTPYAGVAAIFRSALERGEAPRVFEDGGQRRDFVHVDDIARANLLALTAPAAAPLTANVCSGEPHTVGEMATALAAALDGPAPVVTGQWRAGDVRHVVASPARARSTLGFAARAGFAEGMSELATAPLRAAGG